MLTMQGKLTLADGSIIVLRGGCQKGAAMGADWKLAERHSVGARYVAWGTPTTYDNKTGLVEYRGCNQPVLHGELRYLNDMVRDNPEVTMDGLRGEGENPGRSGMGLEAGATYRINDCWSTSANYSFNALDDSREHRLNVGASYTF